MSRIPVVILGIPFDNLSLDEATERVFDIMERSYRDRRSRLVCMGGQNCIGNASYGSLKKMTRSEFFSILWRADMVIAEHMPIVQLSKLLGPALKECITSGDFISCLAREAFRRRKSVYILASSEEGVNHTQVLLEDRFPGLMVAGGHSLSVHSERIEAVDTHENDTVAIGKINASCADILFISLGSPNQEIWFERNRSKLQIPVCICVGDIFASIAGSELCSPEWMRNPDLESLFRSKRTPGQKRNYSFTDLIKFWILLLPSILLHQYSKTVLRDNHPKASTGKILYRYWTRGLCEIFSLTLPEIIDSGTGQRLQLLVPKKPDAHLVLDFSSVKVIDSAGLGFLFHLMSLWNTDTYEILHVGLNRYLKKILACNRMHDFIPSRQFLSQNEVLAYLDGKAGIIF